MVYICMLYAGQFSEPLQPFASMKIRGLYEDSACIVPGNTETYCPTGSHDEHGNSKVQGCWGAHCVSHTNFCASMPVAKFAKKELRDPKTNKPKTTMEPTWEYVKTQHTCCHYPETEDVWENRWARIDLWDEDTFGGNDYLGGLDLDLQQKTDANFTFSVMEHKEDFSLTGNNITVKVATFWHRPANFQVSHEWDADPSHWSSLGLSVTSSDPPWEAHHEFDGRFGNLRVKDAAVQDTAAATVKEDAYEMEQDQDMQSRMKRIKEAQEARDRMKAEWEGSEEDISYDDYDTGIELKADLPAHAASRASWAQPAVWLGLGAAALGFLAYRHHARDGLDAGSLLSEGAAGRSCAQL